MAGSADSIDAQVRPRRAGWRLGLAVDAGPGLATAATAGAAMAAAYLAGPSLFTAALLLLGMSLAAWQFQRQAGRSRWACLALTLILWQAGGMGWITAVLAPELAGAERLGAVVLLFLLLWTLSLGSLFLLAAAAQRLLAGRRAQALALPLAWWAWMALRDLCWWGGGYGSLSLPLLGLPGLGTWLPLVGPALFEALLWAAMLVLTQPGRSALRGMAVAAGIALALFCPAPWSWTAPAGEGLSVAVVDTQARASGPRPTSWTAEARDAALAALHRALSRAPRGGLVVTPELFLPEPPPPTPVGLWGELLAELQMRHVRLLLGTALPHPDTAVPALMNVALMLAPQTDGEMASSVYAKQRMAPVGEELPWPALTAPLARRWLNHASRSGRSAGLPALTEPLLLDGNALGVMICHEVAFADAPAAMAGSLIHLASDRWSGDERSGRQALGLARLRALESGKWLLSVSEGQRPWLIDPSGQARTAREVDTLPARQGLTPYVRWRQLQPAAPLAVLAVLLAGGRRRAAPSTSALAGVSP
ncbi:hypothetical protein [Roseateles sp.]|uniref:hypothetical protein n=1 Tax=Roseateles sp. TaxID=1971397 RepID=UPI002DFCA2E0|nr:hypothetical protein [Roseateles sp.]